MYVKFPEPVSQKVLDSYVSDGRLPQNNSADSREMSETVSKFIIKVHSLLLGNLEQLLSNLSRKMQGVLPFLGGGVEGVEVCDAVPGGQVQEAVWGIALPDCPDPGHSKKFPD